MYGMQRGRRSVLTLAAAANPVLPTMSWLDERGLPNGKHTEIRTVAVLSEAGTRKLFWGSLPVLGHFSKLPPSISIRTTARHSEALSSNVAAVLSGADPTLQNEYVVYTAHLDHLGIREPVNGDRIYDGATDNAGSVAALIEIARAFRQLQPRQLRSILFLAVTGEEKGLLGSDYFVEHPTVPRSEPVADINMDCLNLHFDFRNIVDIGGEHSSLGTVFRRAAEQLDVGVMPDPAPESSFSSGATSIPSLGRASRLSFPGLAPGR